VYYFATVGNSFEQNIYSFLYGEGVMPDQYPVFAGAGMIFYVELLHRFDPEKCCSGLYHIGFRFWGRGDTAGRE